MGCWIRKSWGLMMLVGLIMLGSMVSGGSGRMSKAQCKEERRVGINACKPVLNGKQPSAACCRQVRVSHIECICPVITPKLAALIDVKQAVQAIQRCGRRLPRHFKCGSKSSLSLLSLTTLINFLNVEAVIYVTFQISYIRNNYKY